MSEMDPMTIVLTCVLVAVAIADVVLMRILHRKDNNETYKSIKDNLNNE